MSFEKINNRILPLDGDAMEAAWNQWNSICKPIGSLGVLEDIVVQIAGITGTAFYDISRRIVLAFCADNGVVAEGVTQCGQEVTLLVAENMGRYASSVCQMARIANTNVMPIDMGMNAPGERVLDRHIARGSGNIAHGPAMTYEQAVQAIEVGIDMVGQVKEQGYGLVVTGEMGIGNTTTTTAVACALLGLDPVEVTGIGSGLSEEGMRCKVGAIQSALEVNKPDPNDALDVLAKVGGFDLAGIAGAFIGGALHRVPVMVDGVVSAVGALIAARLCPACRPFMIFSHASAEPVFKQIVEELDGKPIIYAGMRLGEGTGAVCLIPMIDMALSLYSQGTSFDAIGVEAYDTELVK